MTNKLADKQEAAVAKKKTKPPTKGAVAGDASASYPAPASPYKQRVIGGLPEDRYYAASSALETMNRVAAIQSDTKLRSDMKKVAQHKISELQKGVTAMGGEKGKK